MSLRWTCSNPVLFYVSAAHVLSGEWAGKPDGRVSCQDEGWITLRSNFTSYLLFFFFFSSLLISICCFWCFRPCWICTTVRRWSVRGRTHTKHPHLTLQFSFSSFISDFLWPTLGPHALWASALEATRPRGSQQQADVGRRGVYLPAFNHRTFVNQGTKLYIFI